jgi:hypothetical protein
MYENKKELALYDHRYEPEPIEIDGKLYVLIDRLMIEKDTDVELENLINESYGNIDIARLYKDEYNDGYDIDFVSSDLEHDPVIEEA